MEESRWSVVLGPFYTPEGLERRGLEIDDSFIILHTTEGDGVYPHAQFKASGQIEPGLARLEVRSGILEVWNDLFVPAITDGVIPIWMAAAYYLGRGKELTVPSRAEEMMSTVDEEKRDQLEVNVARMLSRMSH